MMSSRRPNPTIDDSQSQNPLHQIQSLENAFSRLSVSNSPPTDYVFPRTGNVFPYGHHNPSYQSPNNNNFNGVPLYPQESLWQNLYQRDDDVDNRNLNGGLSRSHNMYLISEILERQRREILERQRLEILNRHRRELLASIQNQNEPFLEESFYNHVVSGRRHWFDDFRGRILELAKDEHYRRVLQDVMMISGAEEVSCIFLELIDHVTSLMLDPSGNYVIQRLVEICSEEQRTRIILMITQHYFQFSRICKSPQGSRAFEKLLERVTALEERTRIMLALTLGALELCKDVNAHRIVKHCLKYFTNEDTQEFLYVVANVCCQIAKDKNGCHVIQDCVDFSQGEARSRLIESIIQNSLELADDCYGNYVMQHLVSLEIPRVTSNIIRKLQTHFVNLSCNKCGSHVVEKLFKHSDELQSRYIILELLSDSRVRKLLVDPFGNYVIGSAVEASKGEIRDALLQLIKSNSQMMDTNLYGKKLLAKFGKFDKAIMR